MSEHCNLFSSQGAFDTVCVVAETVVVVVVVLFFFFFFFVGMVLPCPRLLVGIGDMSIEKI
jgi:hypothetical protein